MNSRVIGVDSEEVEVNFIDLRFHGDGGYNSIGRELIFTFGRNDCDLNLARKL